MQPPKIFKQYSDSIIILNEFVKEMEKVYETEFKLNLISNPKEDEMFHVKQTYRKAKKLLKEIGE